MQDRFDEVLQGAGLGRRYQGNEALINDLAMAVPWCVDNILEILRREARDGDSNIRNIPDILSGVSDNKTFNAVAFEHDGHYAIAVNYGALILVHDLVNRLLSIPELFPWIGNPSLEDARREFHPTNSDAIEYMRAFIAEPKLAKPNDSVRRDAAKFLFFVAMEFIVSHELCHILYGHVRWHASKTAECSMSEVGDKARSIDGLTYQALEMDADSFAVWMSLLRTLTFAAAPHDEGPLSLVITNPVQAVEMTIISAVIMVGAFFGSTAASVEWDNLTHPPAGVRHAMNMAAVERSLRHMGEHAVLAKTSGNKAWGMMFGKFVLEHIWLRIGNPERREELLLSFGPKGVAHLLKVTRAWGDVQPELDKFSHISLRNRMGSNI